ncbi:MAG TPA: glycosyltransferase family 2 protein, partial [Planctomycetota bacterium]|nr:glycosyltransferase family 2 protein [Planctomycetota bacterium]
KSAHEERLARVVVVDNASPDGTADLVAREHPWVELVRSPENLGYGRGCNLGFTRVRTPFVLFLNADVVIEPRELRELLKFQRSRPRIGMTAPATRILRTDDFQFVGDAVTPWSLLATAAGLHGRPSNKRTLRAGEAPFRTDWLCGAIMLVSSEAFRAVGGFDPRFFLYFEETDLCRRLHAGGWELWAVGTATAVHTVGASARTVDTTLKLGGCLSDHYYRSRYYYVSKHFGRLAAAVSETGELVAKGSRDLLRALLRRPAKHELRSRLKAPVYRWPERTA